jgi:putative endonuclease
LPFVYIVRCVDGTFYTGWSTDVTRRVAAHNAGRGGRYTRTHRPVTLVYQEEVPDRKTAMQREMAIKQYTRARKEQLIAGAGPERPATS